MFEVEIKVRSEHDQVREALADLGVELGPERGQSDTYFNAPHRNFAETDEALRVRHATEIDGKVGPDIAAAVAKATAEVRATVTYKGPRVGGTTKTREEVETEVCEGQAIASILEAVGFESVATVSKIRETGQLDEYTVALDRVAGLGEFVEVERTVTEEDIETARAGARRRLRDIGLDPDEGIETSYLELLLEQ